MKTTKYIILLLMLTVLGSSFYSCSSDDYESRLKELLISDLEFGTSANTIKMLMRGEDLSNYEIQQSDSDSATWYNAWIEYSTSNICVSVEANTSYDSRTANITLKDIKDGYTRSFKITQAQRDAIIVEGDTCTAPADGWPHYRLRGAHHLEEQQRKRTQWLHQYQERGRIHLQNGQNQSEVYAKLQLREDRIHRRRAVAGDQCQLQF